MSRALLVIDVQNEYFTGALPITHPAGHLEQILKVMDAAAGRIPVHPAEARAGVEKGGHADSTWSCVTRLQERRSACPPACCITRSASGAIGTSARPTREGQTIFTIRQEPDTCRCSACGSADVVSRGHVERRFRSLPIGPRPTSLVLPIPRVECRACGVVRQVDVTFADPRRSYTKASRGTCWNSPGG